MLLRLVNVVTCVGSRQDSTMYHVVMDPACELITVHCICCILIVILIQLFSVIDSALSV